MLNCKLRGTRTCVQQTSLLWFLDDVLTNSENLHFISAETVGQLFLPVVFITT